MADVVMPIRPFRLGDPVLLWGVAGVIESINRSLSSEFPIITVAIDRRIRLRVSARHVTPKEIG